MTSTGKPLLNKTALITGSTSGIGLEIAKALADQGANIVLTGLGDFKEIENIRKEIEDQHQVKCRYEAGNLMQAEVIENLVANIHNTLGSIDILINNAGMQHISPIENFTPEKWDSILALNLSSAFHFIRLVLGQMKQKNWGRIINIASAHGLVASPLKSAYVAAKHGLVGLTKVVALEGANHNVTCNAICPGYVLTPLVEKQIPEIAKERDLTEEQVINDVLLHAHARKEFVGVEEIAQATVFLCGAYSASITGVALPIDGGWTAH